MSIGCQSGAICHSLGKKEVRGSSNFYREAFIMPILESEKDENTRSPETFSTYYTVNLSFAVLHGHPIGTTTSISRRKPTPYCTTNEAHQQKKEVQSIL
jgi:hypothetical protein